jgi:ribosomal protein S18 acetylase RimI-like enzyme
MQIRAATASDRPAIWALLQPIIREGETLALPRDADEAAGMAYWSSPEKRNFLAVDDDGAVLGASYIRANQQGPGNHVANCGYMTAEAARGRGVARALCAHSIEFCRQAGFRAIQFNFVVSTNMPAVHLWESHGFRILARLPGAFRHPRLGFVDALVMWKDL